MKLTKDGIRIEWTDLGEGWSGDYNEEDPDDEPLLRFDVYMTEEQYKEFHGERFRAWDYRDEDGTLWIAPQDSSYCTAMPADAPQDILRAALEKIWRSVVSDGCGKNLEEMSWINPGWFMYAASSGERGTK